MAHPNEELIRRASDAISRGDADTLRQLFARDAVFHEPGRNPVSGDHHGIDQILAFFGLLAERSGETYRVPLNDVVANDQHAVGCTSLRPNERDAVCTASRRSCCTCGTAGSPRPGRTTTTSTQPTSSGRRSHRDVVQRRLWRWRGPKPGSAVLRVSRPPVGARNPAKGGMTQHV
jgi:hypothetical protein